MEATGTQATVIDTPLAAHHKSFGANIGAWFGCALPSDFGDWQHEYEFAKNTVALLDKNYLAYFSFTGPDRVRYLNAILTNNVKDLQPGQGNISLLLNPQGRILAEIETQAQPDTPPLHLSRDDSPCNSPTPRKIHHHGRRNSHRRIRSLRHTLPTQAQKPRNSCASSPPK